MRCSLVKALTAADCSAVISPGTTNVGVMVVGVTVDGDAAVAATLACLRPDALVISLISFLAIGRDPTSISNAAVPHGSACPDGLSLVFS